MRPLVIADAAVVVVVALVLSCFFVSVSGCSRADPASAPAPTSRMAAVASPPQLELPQAHGAVVIDGVLNEPEWQRAPAMALRPHLDNAVVHQATTAKMLWTADALYLSFDAVDDDTFSPYQQRDDPLYQGEAYEIFIDADGDADVYVELQSNVFDVHFDSAFAGGARQHMDLSWNLDFTTRTVVAVGRVVQEWRIPIAGLRDVPAGEPRVSARWKVNLFRLERRRQNAKVVGAEASAWSAPLANDFHRLERFGTLIFGP